jgi:hypothetical protein
MDAPELSAQVVDRVRTINFGAKPEVQALTIVYPIDFLPAAYRPRRPSTSRQHRDDVTRAKPPKGGDAKSPV